ncbi:MAG: glycosyltransferase family 2 protein [Methylococcaceae bacterium]|nr:glycosyltransferase family 2 protein [Methylococcaceae bacterium]MDZ4155545.1 glycosyltransferase family 2 protein [Methylococcales bacterium]MDP2395268.1 glycosyltransferase family 2 protein [Methylococcaceae bacterium]MDP3020620.1 glycosyltransferase family 2 protein [Methylococcaceae bacterium]MDP3390059.1 glycosyltransferase family 2 protein [Methylococcaceae bacterium]
MLTVVILTKNEEANLPRCLAAIPERYPIVIVDSGSTDRTIAIANTRASRIYINPWPGFAEQRNFAINQCEINTPWLLFIDADEIYPQAFYDRFEAELAASDTFDVLMVPSILYLRGKRLSHAPGYPIYHPRLVRRESTRFVCNHTGHGEAVVNTCRIGYSDIPYEHYFYHGEIIEWMHKHVDKAAQEVQLKPTTNAVMTTRGRLSVLLGRSWLRVLARFLYHFVFRGGFLDGVAGLEFALMFTWYEATIYLQAKAGQQAR